MVVMFFALHPYIPRCESFILLTLGSFLFLIPLRTMSCSSMGEGMILIVLGVDAVIDVIWLLLM